MKMLNTGTGSLESAEALEKVAHRNCGYPIPGNIQGQAGWGFQLLNRAEYVSAHSKGDGLYRMTFTDPFQPKPF